MRLALLAAVLTPAALAGQGAVASSAVPPAEQQIAGAVLALPQGMRAGAAVLGYAPDGKLVPLRPGTNDMICLASDPKGAQFHAACYHKSLEPFMARGRALRAQGVTGAEVDSVRFREVKAGTLRVPTQPAALYQLFGPAGSFDPAAGTATGAPALYVVYIPFATAASTGLSPTPVAGAPWIMFPGTPKAHIMFTPTM